MRQDMNTLPTYRSLDAIAPRRLLTRGIVRDLDSLATHQSMRGSVPHYRTDRVQKLAPVMRWLRTQAGQPWDVVYAQLREQFDLRSTKQNQVLDRVLNRVERRCFLTDDGQVRAQGDYCTSSYAVDGLYVHPTSGKLGYIDGSVGAAQRRKAAKQALADELASRRVIVKPTLQLHRRTDGLWFWVELAPVTAPVQRKLTRDWTDSQGVLHEGYMGLDHSTICRDVITGQDFMRVPLTKWDSEALMEQYGLPDHYACRKWQASRADVRRYVTKA
jgi:hypothetical protein